MKHLKIHKCPFKNVMVLAIECEKCTWKFSKNFAGLLHFKTDHALRCEENKVEFLEGRFLDEILPSSTKRNRSIFLNFRFPFFVFLRCIRCIFNLEIQNSCLKTSAWWSRGSHFVENGYPSLRFPNMVKVNIHEHWTRVTRFSPLWVSAWTVSRYFKEVQADLKTIL